MGRRVVVTGVGLICAVGNDAEAVWQASAGRQERSRRASPASTPPPSPARSPPRSRTSIRCSSSRKKKSRRWGASFIWPSRPPMKRCRCRNLKITPENAERVGVHIGSGIGGFDVIEREHTNLLEGGPRKISPFFIPAAIVNLAAGPGLACATAPRVRTRPPHRLHHQRALHWRFVPHHPARRRRRDDRRRHRSGHHARWASADSPPCARFRRATTTRRRASRPWDKDRDGFVIGEGAGILILEELEFAQQAWRQDSRGDCRLRHERRRLPHDAARAGARRRLPRHAQCAARRRSRRRRRWLRQCPRHVDADRRRRWKRTPSKLLRRSARWRSARPSR